ncbi:MAG: hypothetical protein KDE27_05950, partial [Planctomycetes bacterium]|nr:hypothetical protein [Planctomycetota bacterium]
FSLADRERMQQDAERSFARLTRRFERRGTAGFEAAFDGELSGRLGIRLVERDSQQKEQLMWSSLRVESGADVRVSIDTGLQDVAEAVVGAARERALLEHGDIPQREAELVQAALAVIDAQSGDVLAFAGAPSAGRTARTLPGLTWQGNGALGSVVKPFVLIEQLLCETDGRGHRALADLEACSGRSRGFRYGGRTLSCDSDHWEEGRDPVAALAKSCNMFFYQVGIGLQRDGLMRAYQRFGLEPAPAGSEFAACWQARVSGIPWASPRVRHAEPLPTSAIGYGVEASPLAVARAYAGLATGRLPTLGVLAGESRPSVVLAGIDAELALVRRGLSDCVQRGTAKRIEALARFQVYGKTGTAEVGTVEQENNAWFAGFLPWTAQGGTQLAFCAVVYWVPNGEHGADAAGTVVGELLERLDADPELQHRYITPAGAGVGNGNEPRGGR